MGTVKAKIAAVVAVALMACGALAVLAQDVAPGGGSETRVVKFASTKRGSAQGKPAMILCVTSKYGGNPLEIAIPNNDPASQQMDPDTAMMAVIKGAQAGDLLKIRYERKQGRLVLSEVEKYTAKPGEVDPEAYEFVKKTETTMGGQSYQAVVLKKLEKEQTVLVPQRKNEQGVSAPDAEVVAQVAKLTAGDFADVQTTQSDGNTYLRSIHPYQAPKSATFVKSGAAKNAAGAMETTVTLKSGEQTVEVYVPAAPGGGGADPVVMSKVRALQANAPVQYKSVESEGKEWLTDIRANRPSAQPTGDITLAGTFIWSGKPAKVGQLKAVLTPTGPGEWKVVYTATYDSKMTYTGTVKGNVMNGEVSGTGTSDGRRTFIWSGTARNGVIAFNHFETTGNKRVATGTGTLRPQ